MFDRYSVSSCHQREKNTSSARHSRATGPAPSWSPSSNAERNMAKLSEMRLMPMSSPCRHSSLTISSLVPFGDWGDRRIRSSDAPLVPHGTSDSIATTASLARRRRPEWPRPAGSRRRRIAESAECHRETALGLGVAPVVGSLDDRAISSGDRSRWRRMRTVRPARRARVTACRTGFMSGPDSLNLSGCRIASSPSSSALRPASRNACAAAANSRP